MNFTTSTNTVVQSIDLNFDSAVRKFAPKSKQCLPESFQPLPDSVIIGKGKMPAQATGNKRLRELVDVQLQNYANAKFKRDKTFIVTNILHKIQDLCPEGAFVKFDGERWWEVSDRISREKIACMFRDSLSGQYKSSNKNKVAKRRAQRAMKRNAALQKQRTMQEQHHQEQLTKLPMQMQNIEPNVVINVGPVMTFNPFNFNAGATQKVVSMGKHQGKRDSMLVLEGLDLMGGLLDIDRNVFDCDDFFGDDEAARVSSDEDSFDDQVFTTV